MQGNSPNLKMLKKTAEVCKFHTNKISNEIKK